MKLTPVYYLILACALSSVGSAETRDWTDRQGRKVSAEFVSFDGKKVTIKLASGKTTSIPAPKLSDEDQQFLKEQSSSSESSESTSSQVSNSSGSETLSSSNFDAPWPKDIKTVEDFKVEAVKDGPDEFIYESPHFQFHCTAKLGVQLIRNIGRIFEATFDVNHALPIANTPTRKEGVKFPIYLFEKKEDYIAAGGPPKSAGVFIGSGVGTGKILVPAESVGIKLVNKSFRVDREGDIKTLIHEITHQLMGNEVKQASWFIEGTAEYVALTPFRTGRFLFGGTRGNIEAYVTGYGKDNKGGRALGKEIQVPITLKEYMNLPYSEFTGTNSSMNYGLAPLLIYYFYHVDGKGDGARIKKYIQALQSGTPENKAQEILLDNRPLAELEKAISKYWRSAGVNIEFKKES